jgi:hypothetical protein
MLPTMLQQAMQMVMEKPHMMKQLAQHMGFEKRGGIEIKYGTGPRDQRNADGGDLPGYTYQPRVLTRKPLQNGDAFAGDLSQMADGRASDAPKRTKRRKKRKVRHALAAERVLAEAPKITKIAPKQVTGEPTGKKKTKARKRARAPIANGVGGPDHVEAPKKKKTKKSGVGGTNARESAASMWMKLAARDAERQRIKRATDATAEKTNGKTTGKKTNGKKPAAAPKASKIRTLGCSKCRYLTNGCSVCAPHIKRTGRRKRAYK